jgi:uroporphyrinogen decarboxylase
MISRRSFVKSSLCAAVGTGLATSGFSSFFTSCKPVAKNKRDLVLSVLDMSKANTYIPAAFFMHFGGDYNFGQAAVDRHLAYFRATDMDFVKIQYELGMPRMELQKPSDWDKVPVYKKDFFEPVLGIIEGVVKEAKSEALIIPTVYSPLMCAGQMAGGRKNLFQQIEENPDAVLNAMHKATESVLNYVKAAIERGADGFYLSTQGMEVNGLSKDLFEKFVRPFDMEVMSHADKNCAFNILHICDYEGKYEGLSAYTTYPGKVVNTPIALADGTPVTTQAMAALFKRPIMGGINRLGEIAKGTPEELHAAVDKALEEAPANFILAADCTIPNTTDWETLRSVIQKAHIWRFDNMKTINAVAAAAVPAFMLPANTPQGDAKGLFPGRVSWVYAPDTATWDEQTGFWFEDRWNNQQNCDRMIRQSLFTLTGKTNEKEAWTNLFANFNTQKEKKILT